MKIAIAGAGAMGSRFGLMLHRSSNEVILIDKWIDHVNAIKKHGLKGSFNGEDVEEKLPIFFPEEIKDYTGSIDLVILFTKAMQLEDMLKSISSILSKNTKVLCLLNGLGHEDVIEKYVSKENILLGNTMWTAGLTGPGEVNLFGNGSVNLQNVDKLGKDFALEAVEVLNKANLNANYSEDVKTSIWKKACVNGTLNCLCTLLDCNILNFASTKGSEDIITTIVTEFSKVAKEEDVILDVEEVVNSIKEACHPNEAGLHFPSMHQDLVQNNRLTEIDYINGAVYKKGLKYNIPTPYCKLLTDLVHSKEEIIKAK